MSWERDPEGLSPDDHNFSKVHKIMVTEVRRVLLFLFRTACPKSTTQNLKNYLLGPKKMKYEDFKQKFNFDQREILKKDPTGNEFDVTLLGAAISASCPGLTEEIEDLRNELRIFRNDFFHKRLHIDLIAMEKKLCDLVEKLYLAIGTQYKIDGGEIITCIKQMKDNVDKIKKARVPKPDTVKYQQELKTFWDELKTDFCDRSKQELRTNQNFPTTTDPISFIPGREATLKVTAVYTKLDIVVHKSTADNSDQVVEFEDILTVLNQKKEIPSIILLEGPTGAGKTMLTKYLYAQREIYLQGGHCSIIDLDKFDIVLPFDSSNSSLASYEDLISHYLPKSTQFLRNEDILRSARQLRVLILVDAADNLNERSEALLKVLLERHVPESNGKLRIMCTTRPQALKDILALIQNSKVSKIHTEIAGVPYNRRGEFVRRLHDEMKKEGQSSQDTEGLVEYIKNVDGHFGDNIKNPLILSLLTYQWTFNPVALNEVSTISKLHFEIDRLIKEKLFVRLKSLKSHKTIKGKDLSEIKNSCSKYFKVLYRESLVLISLNKIDFPENSINNLRQAAARNELPERDVIAAFLSHTCKWTASGYSDQYTGSNYNMIEFLGAFYILKVITEEIKTNRQRHLERKLLNGSLNVSEKLRIEGEMRESKTISGILKDIDKSKPLEIRKYQNVLVYLLGLLNIQGKNLLHQFHADVVKLLESCRQGLDWFKVVSEVECDCTVTKIIAERLTEKENEVWYIKECTNMNAVIEMLKTASPKKVCIKLMTDSSTVTGLSSLVEKLSQSTCIVELEDKWSFKNPQGSSADHYLTHFNSCSVKKILTSIKTIKVLPIGIEDLSLGLVEDPLSRTVHDPGLEDLIRYFPRLEFLSINVKAGAGTEMLPRLPVLPNRAGLILSEMKELHIDWAVNTMKVLQPGQFNRSRKGFGFLSLPNCHLKVDQLCDFVEKLAAKKVSIGKKGYVWVQFVYKSKEDEMKKLRHAIKHNLHCSLHWDAIKQEEEL